MKLISFKQIFFKSAGIRLLGMFSAFFLGVFLARALGPDNYGEYSYIISILAILAIPVEIGLPRAIVREVARCNVNKDHVIAYSIRVWALRSVSIIASCLALVVLIYCYFNNFNNFSLALLIGILFVWSAACCNINNAVLKGYQYITVGQYSDVLFRPLFTLLLTSLIYFLFNTIEVKYYIATFSISALLSYFVSHLLYLKYISKFSTSCNNLSYKHLYKISFPMALSESALLVRTNILIIATEIMLPSSETGVLKVAISSLLLFTFIISVFNNILAPILAKQSEEGNFRESQKLLINSAISCSLISLFIFLLFVFLGDEIFYYVYGSEYIDSVFLFLIMGGGILVSSFFGASSVLLNMSGYERVVTKASLLSMLMSLILIYPLIHYYGVIGGCITLNLSLIYFHIHTWLALKTEMNIDSSIIGRVI